MGYCPFKSRYNGLYRDTGNWAQLQGPRYDQAMPTTRRVRTTIQVATLPRRAMIRLACALGRAAVRARTRPGWRGSRNTKNVSWLGAAFVSQYGFYIGCETALSALQHGAGALRHARQRETRHAPMALVLGVSRYRPATRPRGPTTRPGQACETA